MYVMAISTISDNDKFWGSLKKAYGQLPKGAKWTLAVGSTDGTKAVNVIVHDSIDGVKSFFEEHAGPFGTTEYFEADAANAVGLPKKELATPAQGGTSQAASSKMRKEARSPRTWLRRLFDGSARSDESIVTGVNLAALRRNKNLDKEKPSITKGIVTTQFQAQVSELLSEYGIPSAAIGILHDGEITDFAVGVKNLSTDEPTTTDTIYQCGSMTKTWTALAFMQLVDEGKVGLDEPVRTYLPGFKVADPEVSAKVTPRHLLNHTNGIEEDYGDPGEDDDVYERMVDNIANAPQFHPLGYTHGYSAALGYAILARIMEVIDGKRWDDIMRDRLFDPLGLTSTSSWREQVDQDLAATGHLIRSLEEGPIVSPLWYLPRAFGPGGNVNSTAREVVTMAHVFLSGGKAPNGTRIVSAEIMREMMESRVPIPDPYMFGPEWALGLIVCDWHGETVYAHDGSTVGQSARLRILPDSNIAISMLANGGPRDSFYKKVFNEILTDLGAVTIPDLPKPDPTLKLDLSKYEGAYERPGAHYEVEAEGGKLYLTFVLNPMQAQFLGKPERIKYELLPISETHFLMPSDDPLEDTQTVAIYDFKNGAAQYLHTNCRVNPRVSN